MSLSLDQQTLVLIKPDALIISATGYILSQLSEYHSGMRFAGAKIVRVHRMLAEEHYAEHRSKPFFSALIEYIIGMAHYPLPEDEGKRRVIALVYHGPNAIARMRQIVGPTDPHKARTDQPGSIRSLGTVVPVTDQQGNLINRLDNLIHASANPEDAEREIKLWFRPEDIPPAMWLYPTAVCREHYYFKESRLFSTYSPGSYCLLAPGNVAWQSDLQALQQHQQEQPAACSLETVAAKYLINAQQSTTPTA